MILLPATYYGNKCVNDLFTEKLDKQSRACHGGHHSARQGCDTQMRDDLDVLTRYSNVRSPSTPKYSIASQDDEISITNPYHITTEEPLAQPVIEELHTNSHENHLRENIKSSAALKNSYTISELSAASYAGLEDSRASGQLLAVEEEPIERAPVRPRVAAGYELDRVLPEQILSRQFKNPAFQRIPAGVIREVKAVRKHRRRMSYHWLLLREQLAYVRQERNDLASKVAILQQECENNRRYCTHYQRLDKLVNHILLQNTVLAKNEIELDDAEARMLVEERLLRAAEERLQTGVGLDEDSDDSDSLADGFDLATSLPPPNYGSPRSDFLKATIGEAMQEHLSKDQKDTERREVVVESVGLRSYVSPSVDAVPFRSEVSPVRRSSLQATVLLDDVPTPEVIDNINHDNANANTAIAVLLTGSQFALDLDQGSPDNSSQDVERELATAKRVADLEPVLSAPIIHNPSLDTEQPLPRDAELWDNPNPMLAHMLEITWLSWLEFSRFLIFMKSLEGYGFLSKMSYSQINNYFQRVLRSQSFTFSAPVDRNDYSISVLTDGTTGFDVLYHHQMGREPDDTLQPRSAISTRPLSHIAAPNDNIANLATRGYTIALTHRSC